jgi:hypothetical protein
MIVFGGVRLLYSVLTRYFCGIGGCFRFSKGGGRMDVKRWLMTLMVIVLAFALKSPAFAINGKSNQATLRGLSGVGVLVEKLPPELERQGLIGDRLQMEVELKLRMAGIKVLTREESLKTPGEPHLYVNINVNTAKTESDIYPYSIDVLLIQNVSLLRDPKQTTFAVTWSTGGVGSIEKSFVGQLRDSVEEMVDLFVKAYVSENPK